MITEKVQICTVKKEKTNLKKSRSVLTKSRMTQGNLEFHLNKEKIRTIITIVNRKLLR